MFTVTVTMYAAGTMAVQFPFNRAAVERIKSLPVEGRRWDGQRKVWLVSVKHFGFLCETFGRVLSATPEVFEAAHPMRPAGYTGRGRYWSPEERAQVQVGPFGGGWWDRPRSESPLYRPGRPACKAPILPPPDVAGARGEKTALEAPGDVFGVDVRAAA